MQDLEKRVIITIYLIYAIPTILFVIHNFNISLLDIIIKRCLADCLILPILAYYILKISSLLKYLKSYINAKFGTQKLEIYMHLYITIIISILLAISKAIYIIINPLKASYIHQLVTFQFKIYVLLAAASYYVVHILNRTK